MFVTKRDGRREPLDMSKYERQIEWCCSGIPGVSAKKLKEKARRPLRDGMTTKEINRHLTVTSAELISLVEPNWTYVAARFVLQELYKVATDGQVTYPHLRDYLEQGVAAQKLTPRLVEDDAFDLEALNAAIDPSRDFNLDYLGIQTLADRYLVKNGKRVIELPQHFFMRVAMGVAQAEATKDDRTRYALGYYQTYSSLEALSSTPTLFNSGTLRPQLSSCFGSYMGDAIDSIMGTLSESAHYSKLSGGCSMYVGAVRAKGSLIKSTGGKAGGPIPYITLYDGVLRGFDQSGKRKGSGSFYIEPWHADIFEYLSLKDPGGDPRVRAHDAFPALMIPDLFMERVLAGEYWSLFCPNDAVGLTETYGDEFNQLYLKYEKMGMARQVLPAEEIWHKILTKAFQHGVFWPCWKDEINSRYSQVKTGIVHNSNLCTEITLRNNADTSFVCNLSSVNVSKFKFEWKNDRQLKWNSSLENTVRRMVRLLDSVITLGLIPHPNGIKFQDEDRAVGLGCMGWTQSLYALGIEYESAKHVVFSSEVWKQISLTAIHESHLLSIEKGTYKTFLESTWAEGKLPTDTVRRRKVIEEFGLVIEENDAPFLDGTLQPLREMVKLGMRNSCLMAIAPTATIANIAGCTPCTEMPWDVVSSKGNLSGDFKVISQIALNNPHNLPLKAAREIDHLWTVKAAAARQLHIDQAQSTNYYLDPNGFRAKFGEEPVGEDNIPRYLVEIGNYLDDIYVASWEYGNKTSYYIYSQSAETTPVAVTSPGVPQTFDASQQEAEGAACFLRPGDPGFEDCLACQ